MTQAGRTLVLPGIKYVLAESNMDAAQTKGQEENKHTWMQGKQRKRKKIKTKNGKQEARHHSNKSCRLCYRAETGTLPHHLPSSSCSRRQHFLFHFPFDDIYRRLLFVTLIRYVCTTLAITSLLEGFTPPSTARTKGDDTRYYVYTFLVRISTFSF